MSRGKKFSVLIVRGDGARVLRFSFRRPTAIGAALGLTFVTVAFGLLIVDNVRLRQVTGGPTVTLAEHRAVIESFNRRVVELRREVASWRDLHARIWRPFGRDLGTGSGAPGVGGGTVEHPFARRSASDELELLAESLTEARDNLQALERFVSKAGKALASLPSRWPVHGVINSGFGRRLSAWTNALEFHSGVDIGASQGTPVRAAAGGTVAFAGPHAEYGLTIVIDHGQEIRTVYGHLSRVTATQGQTIERGVVIGFTGNSGRSSGPHLHYEILVKGQAVDPRAYLWD